MVLLKNAFFQVYIEKKCRLFVDAVYNIITFRLNTSHFYNHISFVFGI